jgi:hypothetical protein
MYSLIGLLPAANTYGNVFASKKYRIASQKSSFVRFEHLFSPGSVLVSPPRPQLRLSALEQEQNKAYVREKEEDVS